MQLSSPLSSNPVPDSEPPHAAPNFIRRAFLILFTTSLWQSSNNDTESPPTPPPKGYILRTDGAVEILGGGTGPDAVIRFSENLSRFRHGHPGVFNCKPSVHGGDVIINGLLLRPWKTADDREF